MTGILPLMSRAAALVGFVFVALVGALLGFQAGAAAACARRVAPPGLAGAPPSLAEVVARVNPAVVHVDVIEDGREDPHSGIEDAPALDVPRRGEGSGFLVDADGFILTNHHLVPGTGRIRVRLADKRELHAERIGADPTHRPGADQGGSARACRSSSSATPIACASATGCAPSATRSSSTTPSRWVSSPRSAARSSTSPSTPTSRPTQPSTPATREGRSSTCRARPSASTRP